MASRMRDEAWSAWEQQLGNLSINTTTTIDLSPKPLRLSNKVNLPRNSAEAIEPDKRTASEEKKTSSNPARSACNLNISELHPEVCRSISSNGLVRPSKLEIKRRSFDPSFFPKHTRFNEIEHFSDN